MIVQGKTKIAAAVRSAFGNGFTEGPDGSKSGFIAKTCSCGKWSSRAQAGIISEREPYGLQAATYAEFYFSVVCAGF